MPLNPTQLWWILPLIAVVTLVLALALVPLAQKTGLVDYPGKRKLHETVTPLTGGPAIFIVFTFVMAWILPGDHFVQALGIGGLIMIITGMVDDRRRLSVGVRFLVQLGACLLVILWADVRLADFGRLMWNDVFGLGWLGGPVTIFAAMGVVNAFNLIDGMDGLSGTIFLVAAAGMALFAGLAGQTEMLWLLLISMASVSGFITLNARFAWNPKARVFLGDAGSLFLGFVLAWSFIRMGSGQERAFIPMTAVWLIAVPLLDTTTLIWRRWRSGESAFAPDQYHLHHAFLRAGYSIGQTWLGITVLALVLAGVGVLFELTGVPDYISFYLFIAFAFCYYFYISHSWTAQRLFGREFIYHDFVVENGYE